jgi:hypothetical protein
MRVSVDQHGRINIYHTIPEIRILSKDPGAGGMNHEKPRCRWTQNLASLNPS